MTLKDPFPSGAGSDLPIYCNRYRSRNDNSTPPMRATSYVFDKVTGGGGWGGHTFLEETWDYESPVWNYSRAAARKARRNGMTPPGWTTTDLGHPFFSRKAYQTTGSQFYDLGETTPYYSRRYGYVGDLVAGVGSDAAYTVALGTTLDPSDLAGLDAAGSTAIARCAPASPHASAYTSIGELYREGLPAIPGLASMPRNRRSNSGIGSDLNVGAGEYLNYQFGILPVISDIRQLSTALWNANRILRQYNRDAGRIVRRRYSFPTETKLVSRTVTNSTLPIGGAGFSASPLWVTRGQTVKTVTEITDRWFSGAFTYKPLAHTDTTDPLVAIGGNIEEMIRKAHHLLGVLPTAENLWNLAPWSWAADWVTNIGDVLHNISMFQSDGLWMRWGYVMEHKMRITEFHHEGSVARLTGGGTQRMNLTQTLHQETKRRRAATPLGFGFELNGLTGRQEAILAALAITRGSR